MYKIKGESSYAYDLVGAPCDPSAVAQTLGTGWSWIGYPCASANGLNEAFADAGPQDGDLVKNQTDFAIFTDNEWIGSLTAMTPGDGYNYYSNAPAAKTFHFASVTSSQSYAPAKAQADGAVTFNSLCENTATMIARVMDGDAAVSDAAVSVLSHGELRGYSETEVGEALHFISVGLDSATGDDDYVFSVKVGGYEYLLPLSARLTPNQHIGKIGEPYILQINGSTLIDGITAGNDIARVMLYDTTGVMVMKRDNPAAPFSARDLTSLPQGVYVQCVLYNDGAAKVEKLINR
jgi:hypothetical protein